MKITKATSSSTSINNFLEMKVRMITLICVVVGLVGLFPTFTYGQGQVYGVTCFDGSNHPPGFDCRTLVKERVPDNAGTTAPANDRQSEQRRQEQERLRQERERKQRELNEAEEIARKQEAARRKQFEEGKQNALKLFKSSASELGLKSDAVDGMQLKNTEPTGLKLKEPLFSKGTQGSSPPDLGTLNPKWPIVVDPAKVQGNTPQSLNIANLRTHALLDALEAGAGDWMKSFQYLDDKLKDRPSDHYLRDALNLLRGYHAGFLGAKDVSDEYYKYGVVNWLSGDFDLAARSLARAFRENPDDMLLYSSFAHTLGLRDGSGRCHANAQCTHIEIPKQTLDYELGIVREVEIKLDTLRADIEAHPENLQLRATLNHLEGWAGYHDYLSATNDEEQKPLDKGALELTSQGLNKLGEGDYAGAWKDFFSAYRDNAEDHSLLFVMNYSKGLLAAQINDTNDTDNVPLTLWDERTHKAYDMYIEEATKELFIADLIADWTLPEQSSAADLTRQLLNTESENPFFGILPDEDVERMMLEDALLFR